MLHAAPHGGGKEGQTRPPRRGGSIECKRTSGLKRRREARPFLYMGAQIEFPRHKHGTFRAVFALPSHKLSLEGLRANRPHTIDAHRPIFGFQLAKQAEPCNTTSTPNRVGSSPTRRRKKISDCNKSSARRKRVIPQKPDPEKTSTKHDLRKVTRFASRPRTTTGLKHVATQHPQHGQKHERLLSRKRFFMPDTSTPRPAQPQIP